MKKLIALAILASSFSASAFNINIGSSVEAARLSLSGEVEFYIDCSTKKIEFVRSDSIYFTRHIKQNVHVICYRDNKKYHSVFKFEKVGLKKNMIATQPSRFMPEDNKLMQQSPR